MVQGEPVLAEASFSTSIVWYFLKVSLSVTNRQFMGESQNYLMGFFPVGRNRITCPLNNISSVSSSTNFRFGTFALGLVLALSLLSFSLPGLLAGALGIIMLLSSFQTAIAVTNNGGQIVRIPVVVFERQAAEAFVNQVNEAIAQRV